MLNTNPQIEQLLIDTDSQTDDVFHFYKYLSLDSTHGIVRCCYDDKEYNNKIFFNKTNSERFRYLIDIKYFVKEIQGVEIISFKSHMDGFYIVYKSRNRESLITHPIYSIKFPFKRCDICCHLLNQYLILKQLTEDSL